MADYYSFANICKREEEKNAKKALEIICPFCEKKFLRKGNLLVHIKKGVCQKYECVLENSPQVLENHRCESCGYVFSSESKLNVHLRNSVCLKKLNKAPGVEKTYQCEKCLSSFKRKYALGRHLREVNCEENNERKAKKEEKKKKREEKKAKKEKKEKRKKRREEKKKRREAKEAGIETEKKPVKEKTTYSCEFCDRRFSSQKRFDVHFAKHFFEKEKLEKRADKNCECDFCHRHFSRQSVLNHHFNARICERKRKEEEASILRLTHKYFCVLCEVRFEFFQEVLAHTESVHGETFNSLPDFFMYSG